MTKVNNEKLYKLVATAIFSAAVVVLTLTMGMIKIGSFNLTFALVPIVLAGVFFGIVPGTIAGFAFGLTVFIQCATGLEPSGHALFVINPFYTFVATVVRGALMGFLTALVFRGLTKVIKNMYIKEFAASVLAPVFNTGLFLLIYATLFNPQMKEFAAAEGASALYLLFIIIAGVNFLVEVATTVVVTPPIAVVLEKTVKTEK